MAKKKPNDNKAEVAKWGAIAIWPFQLIRLLRQFGLSLSILEVNVWAKDSGHLGLFAISILILS